MRKLLMILLEEWEALDHIERVAIGNIAPRLADHLVSLAR